MNMLDLYHFATARAEPILNVILASRLKQGKENPERLPERKGFALIERPKGPLFWLHAASVGEAQSALILIEKILNNYQNIKILVTSGTVTSASILQRKLPEGAFHQFFPIDHPAWSRRFLDHWRPDLVLWMESEFWPNILAELKRRAVPLFLINARLSDASFRRWNFMKTSAKFLLSVFTCILAQTEKDAERLSRLGANSVIVTGNLKFSAKPLIVNAQALKELSVSKGQRPLWLFASTHAGEEAMACRVHERLKIMFPDILTIIVPRHPDRREDIRRECEKFKLKTIFRTENNIPDSNTDIFVADTMGELGCFYRLAPVACIGRSFSDDGGGGHNPIEAAQLHCAVLYGPHVQFQKEIYDEMEAAGVAEKIHTENELVNRLGDLLIHPSQIEKKCIAGYSFIQQKNNVVDKVMNIITPYMNEAVLNFQSRISQ